MSDYTTKATVELDVNGQKAKQELEQQRKLVKDLEIAYAKAEASGDKSAKTIYKELSRARRELKSMQSATVDVADVLRRLDKATPKELRTTLKHLNRELNKLERGSIAWNDHAEKIKRVKAELDAVNKSLSLTQTKSEKFWEWINKWQTPLTAIAGTVKNSLLETVSGSIRAYADMDSAMANTQKFTGMTREEVELLNEEFKKMDTRTSREELNELAQAAGRLGKNSVEDVMGFVRAGDIIGVAMNELGADAPQIISQLARIFNLESEMGTEQAMLSVGSAINTLSQNCAASAPHLVDFAGRLGAIASSTHMSMDEMLAFGALLDDQKVSIEKSSTAIQGVITKMYANPADFAQKAGMDVMAFTEALGRSSTEGVMMFVEALSQMDQMQQAATLDKLGTAGAGVVQTFQTLAGKVDLLKTQMQTSKTAFDEATSAIEEYNVQNNTVQAGLDKAKQELNEVTIALGKNLMPVMQGVIGGASQLAKFLITIINYLFEYKGVLITLTASIIAYNIAVNAAAIKTKLLVLWQGIAKTAMVAWRAVTLLATATTALFTANVTRATAAFKLFSATLKLSPIGLIVSAVSALAVGLLLLAKRTDAATQAQNLLNKIRDDAKEKIADEKTQIELLIAAAKNEKLSLDERKKAIDKLNGIIPDYNAHLDETTGKYTENTKALEKYIASLVKKYELEGAEEQLKEIGAEKSRLAVKHAETETHLKAARKNAAYSTPGSPQTSGGAYAPGAFNAAIGEAGEIRAYESQLEQINKALDILEAKKKTIQDVYGIDLQKKAIGDSSTETEDGKCPKCHQLPCVCYKGDGGDNANRDRFEAEKAWKEREEALNRISYATGQKSYEDYRKRVDEIAVEYYDKLMNHTEASADERLQYETRYYDALQKQQETNNAISLETENANYIELLAQEKQRYIDGKTSLEAYDNTIEIYELEHKRRIVQIYQEGTQERLKAEREYQDALFKDMQRRNAETEAAEKKHQDQLAKMKSDYFGDNPSDRQSKYDNDLKILTEVYNAELKAAGDNATERLRIEEAYLQALVMLRMKYNPDNVDPKTPAENSYIRLVKEFDDWMKGEGGQAVLGTMDLITNAMGGIFRQMSSLVQAELEIQTAGIEKRYDKEISLAEGNTYKVAKLEKQKEKEISKAKSEASKKQFAMQVIQTVAQTAIAGLNAYSSTLAIPIVGPALAPAAMALAIATGMLQVVALKKQQQASAAQGYATGGFTPKGGKYEPAGIVHKGEWVASQELLASPVARPLIEALDYAQRTNTIGSLKSDDVSRAVSAPTIIASSNNGNALSESLTAQAVALAGYASVIRRLNERLDEPFVTVNTVTGDTGIKKAQDDYEKLIRNKRPKYRKV